MTATAPYRHAPLVWVVLDVRHPQHEVTRPEIAEIKKALADELPLYATAVQQANSLQIGPGGVTQHQAEPVTIHQFWSRDRRTSVSCAPEATTLETSAYVGWSSFRALAQQSIGARLSISGLDGIQRVGLRYIDEVRVPGPEDRRPAWEEWIEKELLPPMSSAEGLTAIQQQSVVQYVSDRPNQTVTMRYGTTYGPPAVLGPARPNPPGVGHYFLFDTDAAWTLGESEPVPEITLDQVMAIAEDLHGPSKELFEWWPTARLREEVFDAK